MLRSQRFWLPIISYSYAKLPEEFHENRRANGIPSPVLDTSQPALPYYSSEKAAVWISETIDLPQQRYYQLNASAPGSLSTPHLLCARPGTCVIKA
jgi:hypothetical protein